MLMEFHNVDGVDGVDVYLVDALVREEVNTIDTSDLFLDVFVNDDFNNYGGLLTLEHDDATSNPGAGLSVSVVQQPLPPRLMTKSRFTRSTTTEDNNLLEKLKEMARNSKTDESFDTQKFADLLDEYTRGL